MPVVAACSPPTSKPARRLGCQIRPKPRNTRPRMPYGAREWMTAAEATLPVKAPPPPHTNVASAVGWVVTVASMRRAGPPGRGEHDGGAAGVGGQPGQRDR